jgi:hypothetical protein
MYVSWTVGNKSSSSGILIPIAFLSPVQRDHEFEVDQVHLLLSKMDLLLQKPALICECIQGHITFQGCEDGRLSGEATHTCDIP